MIKHLSAFAVVVALSACSSGSDDNSTGGNTGGTPSGGGTPTVPSGPITPSGSIVGAWFGNNNYGDGVMIIDASENVFAYAANGSGQYQTVFGPSSGQLQNFFHRDSENAAFADSYTLAGDRPSQVDPAAADSIAYNLTAQNDGQQISHVGAGGDFTMAFATENDLPAISLDSIAGDWVAKTSFCPTDCNITLEMSFTDTGGVSGSTQFNDGELSPLAGTVSVAAGATQYLNVSFTWLEKARNGVVHLDRLDPTRLIVNTVGPDDEENKQKSFTARMIRR